MSDNTLPEQTEEQIRAVPVFLLQTYDTVRGNRLMQGQNANVYLCGIRNLLLVLGQNGFSRRELRNILARIAAQTGADIILDMDGTM